MLFSEVTASSLIKVDQDGKRSSMPKISGSQSDWLRFAHAPFTVQANDRVCVFHAHPIHAMAVSCLEGGLLPLTVWSLQFYNRISYHPIRGPPVRLDERDRLLTNLGATQAMLMQNHGVFTTGRSVAEAFTLMLLSG